jgi:hypothetical protein
MIDAVFADVPTLERGVGWRAFVEGLLRGQWQLYREHGWLARALSVTRPQVIPNGMRHTESLLSMLEEHGLTPSEAMQVHLTSMSFVRGLAIDIESEQEAEAETGVSREDWLTSRSSRRCSRAAATRRSRAWSWRPISIWARTPCSSSGSRASATGSRSSSGVPGERGGAPDS